jgi:hypothetical protein
LLRARKPRPRKAYFRAKIRKGDQVMQFQKGERGNPAGRPRAARNWVTVLVQDLLAAVAAGDLTPSQGADLADVIDVYVRARAATSFEERLAKLEGAVDRRRARPPTPASRRPSAVAGNDRWVRSIVFGLLFTMKRATPTAIT